MRLLPHNAGKSAILSYCLHSDIIAMRIFTGALRRTSKRCKGFGDLPPKNLAPEQSQSAWQALAFILISNKMLYLKSRVFHTLVPHVPCVTPSHKNLTRLAL